MEVNYYHFSKEALLDLLARYTDNYTKLWMERENPEKLKQLKDVIKAIQAELNTRGQSIDSGNRC